MKIGTRKCYVQREKILYFKSCNSCTCKTVFKTFQQFKQQLMFKIAKKKVLVNEQLLHERLLQSLQEFDRSQTIQNEKELEQINRMTDVLDKNICAI